MSIASKAALWFTICGFVQKGISFITVPIFTRLLTTEQYGVVSIFYSWESDWGLDFGSTVVGIFHDTDACTIL